MLECLDCRIYSVSVRTAQKTVFIFLDCRISFILSSYRTENSVHMFRLSSFLRSQFVPHRKLFICLDCRISFVLSSYRTVNSVHMFILSHFLRSQFVPHGKHFISVKKNNKGNMLSMNLKLTYVPLKCLLSLSCFKQNQKVTSKFSKNREKINVLEILCGCNRAVSCGRADVRTCGRT